MEVPRVGSIGRMYAGVCIISAATLLLELTLTRVFDVILWSNLAYLFVSSAILGFGLGGTLLMHPRLSHISTERLVGPAAWTFTVATALLIPAIGWSPADFDALPIDIVLQTAWFVLLYLFLLAPFVASGILIATMVNRFAHQIHRLYFWDLLGAGIGCLGIFILPSILGGEATLLAIATAGAVAICVLSAPRTRGRRFGTLVAIVLLALTLVARNRIEFHSLVTKRGVRMGDYGAHVEYSHWDPVAKIDVRREGLSFQKRVAYDGGSQSSAFFQVDGDLASVRRTYFDTLMAVSRYNSGKYVALAHWLQRDRAGRALVIGSAGGQETLAALVWGASHVDAVEMVCTVVTLTTGRYARYTGNIFNSPRVAATCDEGRSFLRHTRARYDVIQIHSNHTVSSIANGSGGAQPINLQTVEAYIDYFTHLSPDGILQINYFAYPRMITTAAQAWRELFPREDFREHLVITTGYGDLPTFLVKRSPWMPDQIASIRTFLSPAFADTRRYEIIYAPGEAEMRNVPPAFFDVPLRADFVQALPYNVTPSTDNQPFFRDLRKGFRRLEADSAGFIPPTTANFLNASLRRSIPMEKVQLYGLGGMAIVVSALVLFVPLARLQRKKTNSSGAGISLLYFGCLGAGFIIVEVTLLYKLVLLVGQPIYSMATVLFTLLVAAAFGSALAERLVRAEERLAGAIYPAIVVLLLITEVSFPALRELTLGLGQGSRMAAVALSIAPLGVVMGMPFPLGIRLLNRRLPGLVPWMWGVNAFMTVVGSLAAVVLSLHWGFDTALSVAAAIYLVAGASYLTLARRIAPAMGSGNL